MAKTKQKRKPSTKVKIQKTSLPMDDLAIFEMLSEEETILMRKNVKKEKTAKAPKVKNPWVLSSIDIENVRDAATSYFAFKKLLESNKGYLEQIILKYVRRNDDMFDDLYQIACLSLHKALQKYDSTRRNKSKFITFAWAVIKNDVLLEVLHRNNINKHEGRSLESFRYREENSGLVDENWAVDFRELRWLNIPSYNMEDRIINNIARQQYLDKFSELEREIITLRLQNMKIKDIARKVGKNVHLVKNIYYKAVRKPYFRELIASE
jgi:RNA polymerase sigma factor (sigma-70 family)